MKVLKIGDCETLIIFPEKQDNYTPPPIIKIIKGKNLYSSNCRSKRNWRVDKRFKGSFKISERAKRTGDNDKGDAGEEGIHLRPHRRIRRLHESCACE